MATDSGDSIQVLAVKAGLLSIPKETQFHTIELDGILYSREIFQFFGFDADAGDLFRFVRRQDRGLWLDRCRELKELIENMEHDWRGSIAGVAWFHKTHPGERREPGTRPVTPIHDDRCQTCKLREAAGIPLMPPNAIRLPA